MTVVEGENIDLEESQPSREAPSTQSMGALAGKASSSAVWTILGQGGGQAVRLVSNLIVTRLLLTEYFGLMALVQVFLIGLQLFSDMVSAQRSSRTSAKTQLSSTPSGPCRSCAALHSV